MAENSRELKTISTAKENKSNPYSKDVIVDPMGQWKHPGKVTKIPSNNITMKGVPYPVLGVDNLGNIQMMMPGGSYVFAGSSVTEYPIMQKGGVWGTPEQMYNDSLNLWKAYQFQKAHMQQEDIPLKRGTIKPASFTTQGGIKVGNYYNQNFKTTTPDKEYQKAKAFRAYTESDPDWYLKPTPDKYKEDPNSPGNFGSKSAYLRANKLMASLYGEAKGVKKANEQASEKIMNYYESLPFNAPVNIGYYTSPDLGHSKIDPIANYFDGSAWSPVYKKPVYDPSKQTPKALPGKEPVETLSQNVVDYLERKPAPMFQVNQQEQELIIPKQAAKQDTSNMRIAWRMDPDVKKMVPVIGEKNQPVSKAKRIYNKDVPTASAAIPVDFIPEYDAPPSFQIGGWLDKYEQDEFRLGGFSREALKRTSRKSTSKNIQSSINKLFLRNEDLFGPSGKRVYDPKSKKQEGGQANGWLDKYDGL